MPVPLFCDYGTPNPVQIGDRILVRSLMRRARLATIVYIPGQSHPDRDLGQDQWAFKTDDGRIYAAGFSPQQLPHPGKKIDFVCRAGREAEEVIRSYEIPPESDEVPAQQRGRDLLALIGCATIIALLVVFIVTTLRWAFS